MDKNKLYRQLQERLRLHKDYLETDIPGAVARAVKKLLRDYYFPDSYRVERYLNVAAGTQSYTLPTGCRRIVNVLFYDTTPGSAVSYGSSLERVESITRPHSDGIARYFWTEVDTLYTDVTIGADCPYTNLFLLWKDTSVDYNLDWLVDEYFDVLFDLCMFRISSELSKTELAQTWSAIWAETRQAIAVYQNELEFDNIELVMNKAAVQRGSRYRPGE